MPCEYCKKDAVYRCRLCGRLLCVDHARLTVTCPPPEEKAKLSYSVSKARTSEEESSIRELVKRFWGEEEQLSFDRKFVVPKLTAYVARMNHVVIGFVSFAETSDAVVIVALAVLPRHQNSGIGSRLVREVENEAKKLKKRRMLVSTSNDDLPALAFYQALGFQIFEVKPNVVAEKHGALLKGIGGVPVRDELRLQKMLF